MTANDKGQQEATEHYWTLLPRYIAALDNSIVLSQQIAGISSESRRHYWTSLLFTRLCSAGINLLHLCPGSPGNETWTYWDFSPVAALVRSVVRTALHLFYFGTEVVKEDESRARLLLLQLWDAKERARLFHGPATGDQQQRHFEAAADRISTELLSNSYFAGLPARRREDLLGSDSARILEEDQTLDRMGLFNEKEHAFLGLIVSHADVSPLSYYRTGDRNWSTGDENPLDQLYIAMGVDVACDVLTRAHKDVQLLFSETLSAKKHKRSADTTDDRISRAIDFTLQWEGGNLQELIADDASGEPVLCSECFHDEGLRRCASAIGQRDLSKCPTCSSQHGLKLNRKSLAHVADRFFVLGTVERMDFGAAPLVQFNKHQRTSIQVPHWLEKDLRLIERTLGVGFFPYGPRLWMVGEVEPLKALGELETRSAVISRILTKYPGRILGTDESFYRVRKWPAHSEAPEQYDAPPSDKLGQGRFDTTELPILYGSQDLEVCLHECRVTAEDRLFVASLAPTRALKLLNLAEPISEEGVTEFTSLDMAVHMLFLAGSHSYGISREIASAAQKHGFDGLVYPSYFSLLRTGARPFETTFGISHRRVPRLRDNVRKNTIQNLALFGRPIADGLIAARSINRVSLSKVEYELNFGPLLRAEA